MTPPCTKCKHCIDKEADGVVGLWIYCDFDESWISEEYAFSDLECDAFEQKLDDNETEESSA